jgi:hypothetical protein
MKNLLQQRGIHDVDVLQVGKNQLNAPQAVADEAEAHSRVASHDDKDLQNWAFFK